MCVQVTSVKVYLPDRKQKWTHWREKKFMQGGNWYEVAAPLGEPAVFATENFSVSVVWDNIKQALIQLQTK